MVESLIDFAFDCQRSHLNVAKKVIKIAANQVHLLSSFSQIVHLLELIESKVVLAHLTKLWEEFCQFYSSVALAAENWLTIVDGSFSSQESCRVLRVYCNLLQKRKDERFSKYLDVTCLKLLER
jgi:hypothetical protein